ncbi:MAG: polyphosphate kinase 2 [Acidithiobacillus sp.]|nr:polyphosphate kinase 2 [Acidithiobacillus sp.]
MNKMVNKIRSTVMSKQEMEMDGKGYKEQLQLLQIELVKLQRHIINKGNKILIILEGRDGAGKDGTIKRIIEHLSPRETRVVALPKPSDREQTQWYFQRYLSHLPAAAEFVLFNRSWYNRAGVERVMGFCTEKEVEDFFLEVGDLEEMLIRSGIILRKFYLDITQKEQKKRLAAREKDPLKQWKTSPIDQQAVKHWKDYSKARNEMFARSHSTLSPWTIVHANDKKSARLQLIRDLLLRLDYAGKDLDILSPDRNLIFDYDPSYLENGMIAP